MTSGEPTPYDVVSYGGHVHQPTYPGRLATVASIYGMQPAPPARCRVLELGCGDGSNLLPIACTYPDSEFIGVDLSARAIERGQRDIAALGLRNVELRHADILAVTGSWGRFDYVIAHGVYSWVPQSVREHMLLVFKTNLAPQGVVYVSYNAYPGSHLRNLTRDMMLFHVRRVSEPRERIGQARSIMTFLADSAEASSVHGAVMRDQNERVRKMGDAVLFHDDLDEASTPFLLHQVVDAAARHGLQYLGDATFSRRDLAKYADATRQILEQFPADEFMARDQYQDFIDGHGFRTTLLCHDDIVLRRDLPSDFVRRYHISCSARPAADEIELSAGGAIEFKIDDNVSIATAHPFTNAAILHLGARWPEAVAFDALIGDAERLLTEKSGRRYIASAEDIEKFLGAAYAAVSGGQFHAHLYPLPLTVVAGERPQASAFARMQAVRAARVVANLRHTNVLLEDELVRRFIQLVDGTRDVDALVAALKAETASAGTPAASNGGPRVEPAEVTRDTVETNLRLLGRLGLLVS
jgi:methyltransferase-like protein/protein-L-isoaspartate O-methyltransferase